MPGILLMCLNGEWRVERGMEISMRFKGAGLGFIMAFSDVALLSV